MHTFRDELREIDTYRYYMPFERGSEPCETRLMGAERIERVMDAFRDLVKETVEDQDERERLLHKLT